MGALLRHPTCGHCAQALHEDRSAHPIAEGQNPEVCDETKVVGGGNQAEETNSQIQTTTGLHMEYKQSCANKL